MKILLLHNYYQNSGGEDAVFHAERDLLLQNGNTVLTYEAENKTLSDLSPVRSAAEAIWSRETYTELAQTIKKFYPDIVHVHNTFLRISPSSYYACHKLGVPVVQTLHNYRLICPSATLFRDGEVCEDCLGKMIPWPGVQHACYRNSRSQTSIVAGMIALHQLLGTWRSKVNTYIALTAFSRQKFIDAGFPSDRIVVKPNFINSDDKIGIGCGKFVLFVGRLSQEKGVQFLLDTWESGLVRMPLVIAGDGPLAEYVTMKSMILQGVTYLGRQTQEQIARLMEEATCLILPSLWYEGFPMVIVEAFAKGLPVIASKLGSMATIVDDNRTGFHFSPGEKSELIQVIERISVNQNKMNDMRREARLEYEKYYTPSKNYGQLIEIYEQAIARSPA